MSIINEKLPDAIEGFINTVIGPGKIDNLSIQDDLSIKTAVKMAYNDAKRTMTGLGKKGNEKKAEKKEDALKDIAEGLHATEITLIIYTIIFVKYGAKHSLMMTLSVYSGKPKK